jgi:hypothetical protein
MWRDDLTSASQRPFEPTASRNPVLHLEPSSRHVFLFFLVRVNHSRLLNLLNYHRTAPPVDPTAPTFHPVSSRYQADQLFGELTPKDTEWLCAGGFVTETQSFYVIAEDGTTIIFQVIHSSLG